MTSENAPRDTAVSSPRSKITPERAREIFQAVLDLLRESGYEALTLDAVATRAKASRATLYRQWQTKPRLVAAALRRAEQGRVSGIDTGTLAGDLREVARSVGAGACHDTPLVHALSHATLHNPDLQEALREALIEPYLAGVGAMVRRAVERGEIAADNPAADYVALQLLGVLRVRPLVEGRYGDAAYLTRFLEAAVLPALGIRE